ncbi:MAG: SAM-dependent methyltransferase [Deltaproteobacteria bacterium]|nr:SAM-dependent methyltransferase [Deltaproteobacteria bacterium]|tara:strand:- start:2816 stop:3478 length:663 start_codon:yes stop_codon:yes gene_type:complete
MSSRNAFIEESIYNYLLENSLRELPVLKKLREETQKMPLGRMQISPDQGQLMAMLVRLILPKKIVEVGTFTGYSSLVMALALPENGKVFACDISEKYTRKALSFWKEAGVADKIELRLGHASESLDKMLNEGLSETVDMAFIDADKENYKIYYEKCLELLRPGGLILIDNVLWYGRPADPDASDADTVAIREFNKFVYRDSRVDISLLSVGDGLTLARKL